MAQILPPLILPTHGPGTPTSPNQGPPGPAGPSGDLGPQGPPGPENPGVLTGDVTGTIESNIVEKIRGNAIQPGTYGPSEDGLVLTWVNADGYLELKPASGGGGSWPTTEPGTVSIPDSIHIESTTGTVTLTGSGGMAPGIRIESTESSAILLESATSLTATADGSITIHSINGSVEIHGHGGEGAVALNSDAEVAINATTDVFVSASTGIALNATDNIEINAETGFVSIIGVSGGNDGGIELRSQDDIFMQATGGNVAIEASQDLRANTSGSVRLTTTTTDNIGFQVDSSNGMSLSSSGGDIIITALASSNGIELNSSSGVKIGNGGNLNQLSFYNDATIDAPTLTIPNPIRTASIFLTAQTASITDTDLIVGAGNGFYEVEVYLTATTAGSGGTVFVTIGYTDGAGATTQVSPTLTFGSPTRVTTRLLVELAGGSGIFTYATTADSLAGGAEYSLRISTTKIG